MELRIRLLYHIAFCAVIVRVLVSAQNGAPIAIRIACGSTRDSESPKGIRWLRDFGFTGGKGAKIDLYNAVAPQLRTVRYFESSDGPENCYNVTVPNGHYLVRMVFAYGSIDNSYLEPQFDVSIEGTLVYTFNRPGWNLIRSLSYAEALVRISDGAVTVCFHSSGHGNPSISSLEIRQMQELAYHLGDSWSHHTILKTLRRISCSSNATGYEGDFDGNAWGGNRYWGHDRDLDRSVTSVLSTTERILGAGAPPNFYPESLYRTSSIGGIGTSLSYNIEVEPNQNYSLWFHFAEISSAISSKEQRVLDIIVNDEVIFPEVDIVGYTGEKFKALVLNKTILIQGRTLSITFKPIRGGVLINGFEIYQVIRTEYVTRATEVWALQALKHSLGLPPRVGWNGDPCVPQEHPWHGVSCGFTFDGGGGWFIDGMDLDDQGLKGYIANDLSFLTKLQTVNLSSNNLKGQLPTGLGMLTELVFLDLSYNELNGSIPQGLGKLTRLRKLYLNGNMLTGPVPTMLLAGPIRGASFNFSDNRGLCGIPGLKSCGLTLSTGAKVGLAFASVAGLLIVATCAYCLWQRNANLSRAAASRNAPYAKSRTNFTKDLQLTKVQSAYEFGTRSSRMYRVDDLGSPYRGSSFREEAL